MKVKLFRCRICGDPYLGSEPPSYCPFCGAPQKYLVPAEEYVDRNDVPNLSAQSRTNLEKALDLEVRNAAFYMCASDCAQDPVAKAMFKALWRTEAEHASLICKILKVPKPEIKPDDKACLKDPKANFAAAHQREKSAVVFYGRSANEATEDRVKEVFTALSAVETTTSPYRKPGNEGCPRKNLPADWGRLSGLPLYCISMSGTVHYRSH